eukprot:4193760-Prymnesium_polylepis.1
MLDLVVGYMRPREVKGGDEVIKQGDRGDYFYVVESGAYNVLVNGAHVHTYAVDEAQRIFPTFGELALMYAKPRAAGVVANTEGKLWMLGRSGFRQVQSMANSTRPDPTKVLRKVEMFAPLRYDQLLQLRDAMSERVFQNGDFVFNQDDDADGFYIISAGQTTVLKRDEAAGATDVWIELTRLGPGSYFGERALLFKERRSASVRVSSEDLHCLFISRQQFEKLLGPLAE